MSSIYFCNNKNLIFKTTKDFDIQHIQELYKTIGWKEKEHDLLLEYVEKSLVVVSVWDDNELIGIARATLASNKEVTIWDVAVYKEYQNNGIGSQIMKCMLTLLDDYGIPVVTLYADPGKEYFYERFGFVPHKTRLLAMIRKN